MSSTVPGHSHLRTKPSGSPRIGLISPQDHSGRYHRAWMRGRKSAGRSCIAKCMPTARRAAGSRSRSCGFREFPGFDDARVGLAMDRSRERG